MSFQPTEEQRAAIGAHGKIIVSASAGSGKTAVMIERLVSLIVNGVDVREILAVTYTKKAAAQMREKLRNALIGKIGELTGERERKRLKEQLSLLSSADICTMHVFCSRLIRSYFYLVGIDPAFRIVGDDDAEAKTYSARALNETFENAYETNGEDFQRLLSVYFRRKSDKLLREIVLKLYQKTGDRPDRREMLETVGKEDEFAAISAYIQGDYVQQAQDVVDCAETCKGVLKENAGACRVADALIESAQKLFAAKDLYEMTQIEGIIIPKMPAMTKLQGETLAMMKSLQSASVQMKKIFQELKTYTSREMEYARYQDARVRVRMLADLVSEYDERLTALKRDAGVLSYHDLEYYALKILQNDEARASVHGRYRYLFVDEYQDVNLVQEQLLSLIGNEEVFYVGDAKQAIYAFRGSRSQFFIDKVKDFSVSLKLSESFRSAPAVLEMVNRVFSHAMTETCGGIDYKNTSQMTGGSRYGAYEGETAMCFLRKGEKPEKEYRGVYSVLKESAPKVDPEAKKIADIIEQEIHGRTYFDADEGVERPVDYGDIAVLVRKKSGLVECLLSELNARNIPVSCNADVNVCNYWETRLLIDWLSFLDNQEQDIPRAGAMLSAVGGFCEQDLATIRERFPSVYNFRDACEEYRNKMQNDLARRLLEFEEKVMHYRTLSYVKTAADMMNRLLSDGLEAEIAAKSDGEARLMRVHRLVSFAEGNINFFLHRLQATEENIILRESGGDNAIKIVTMHSSKGLEYPVVILANMDTPFHGADDDEVVYTDRFLFAPKSFDAERKIIYPNVLRRASAICQKREEVKGELNLLYVAMTRAKYRLYLVLKEQEKAALLPRYATNLSQFLNMFDCRQYVVENVTEQAEPLERYPFVYRDDEAMTQQILKNYRHAYPFEASTLIPVKSSATELLREQKAEQTFSFSSPQANFSASSIEAGIAYHTFLQNVTFGQSVSAELARMVRDEILSHAQEKLLDVEKLEKIMQLSSLKDLQQKQVWREQTFLMRLTAREIGLCESDDEIVLQGAIDLLVADENGYTVIDYKYSGRSDEELKQIYLPQIELYRKAVAKVMRVSYDKINVRILNILRLREIDV